MLTQEYLKSILKYDIDTGNFIWLKSIGKRSKIGQIAGFNNHGYNRIIIKGKAYSAHRLVWLYVYGKFPNHQIDHINHNRIDNRLCNLREVTHRENSKNQRKRKTNTSGFTGVYWNKKNNKWMVAIRTNNKNTHLGLFDSINEAIRVRLLAEEILNYHFNHGGM